ncbi:hypothetical protein ABT009_32860 [Streptomyces sp. NPDC002896]|uniref:hypothetical protein n=1 Tax=Streptomyces sp. NPDC002896 TaxID=3154438 RepID=UPI00331764BF
MRGVMEGAVGTGNGHSDCCAAEEEPRRCRPDRGSRRRLATAEGFEAVYRTIAYAACFPAAAITIALFVRAPGPGTARHSPTLRDSSGTTRSSD